MTGEPPLDEAMVRARKKVWQVLLSFWTLALIYWIVMSMVTGLTTLGGLGICGSVGSILLAIHGLTTSRRAPWLLTACWVCFAAGLAWLVFRLALR